MSTSETAAAAPTPGLPTRDLVDCLLCRSTDLRSANFAYLYGDLRFPGVRCARCGLVFLSRQPTAEGLAGMYDASYFDADYHCGHHGDYASGEAGHVASARTLLGWIEREIPVGRILEVGCAGGHFLIAARERGWSPVGIEISDSSAARARDEFELDVRTGTLDTVDLQRGSFDAVYMGDVLEHLPEPAVAVRKVHRLLRPGGVLLLAGPITLNSIDRRLALSIYRAFGRTRLLREPPYHLAEFTPRTLRVAIIQSGFVVRWLRQQKIPPALGNPRHRPPVEHAAKVVFDVVGWMVTALSRQLGDRAVVLAMKPDFSA